jgi:hypothetical protein
VENPKEVREKLRTATTQEDEDVRALYLAKFDSEVDQFVEGMSTAFERWRKLDENSSSDVRRAYASAHVYSAINLHIASMNLFLSGWLVAAGNIQRQVLESIAMAFLIAAKTLDVFDRYERGKFSSNQAPALLLKHHQKLGLHKDAVETLIKSIEFYHNWSHINLMTIATQIESHSGNLYVGAAYDEQYEEQYRKEAKGRANLASVFDNFVIGVGSILQNGTASN